MKRLALIIALLPFALSGPTAGCSSPTETFCDRPNEGEACAQGHTVEVDGDHTRVVLRTTVQDRVEYTDSGHDCVLIRTRCVIEECNYFGSAPSNPIQACREQYGR